MTPAAWLLLEVITAVAGTCAGWHLRAAWASRDVMAVAGAVREPMGEFEEEFR